MTQLRRERNSLLWVETLPSLNEAKASIVVLHAVITCSILLSCSTFRGLCKMI